MGSFRKLRGEQKLLFTYCSFVWFIVKFEVLSNFRLSLCIGKKLKCIESHAHGKEFYDWQHTIEAQLVQIYSTNCRISESLLSVHSYLFVHFVPSRIMRTHNYPVPHVSALTSINKNNLPRYKNFHWGLHSLIRLLSPLVTRPMTDILLRQVFLWMMSWLVSLCVWLPCLLQTVGWFEPMLSDW